MTCVKDSGVLLDSELTCKCHYDNIIARANRQLGFMCKVSSEFREPLCLKSLYCSLVRYTLETNAVIWCPIQANWSARIEAVQKKFVRYALRNLPWRDPLNLPSYENRCRLLGIQPLDFRRRVFLLQSFSPTTLTVISAPDISAPERPQRRRNYFYLETRNRLFGSHEPIRFVCLQFNEVSDFFNFNISIYLFNNGF